MLQICFYPIDQVNDSRLKYAVIVASFGDKWVFCRHRLRSTWEIPGGHRENGESIENTARRELHEETGAIDFDLYPLTVYGVKDGECETCGMLYRAVIHELSALDPFFEIEEISFCDALPSHLTYPHIQPALFDFMLQKECRSENPHM